MACPGSRTEWAELRPWPATAGRFGRLEHVVRHWLSEGERSALLCWLMRRVALGQPPVPEAPIPPPRQPPGTAPSR